MKSSFSNLIKGVILCYLQCANGALSSANLYKNRIAASDLEELVDGAFEKDNYSKQLCNDYYTDLISDGHKYRPVFTHSRELGGECRIGDFEIGKTLGRGGLGTVKIARHVPSGKKVAIKIGHPKFGDTNSYIRSRNEECLHHRMDHRLIAKHYCTMVSSDGTDIMLVVELVPGSNLQHTSRKKSGAVHLSGRNDIKLIAAQIAMALEYIHERGVVLRDVKPGNVMITRNGMQVKMIDFGLAIDIRNSKCAMERIQPSKEVPLQQRIINPIPTIDEHTNNNPIDPAFNDPTTRHQVMELVSLISPHKFALFEEIRRHNQYRPYVDYYGLGVIIYELYTGKEYKRAQREHPSGHRDKQRKGFVCFKGMETAACDFIERVADLDWTRNAQLSEVRQFVRNHPWFLDVDWNHI